MNVPILSVVIPVYNEEASLQMLFDRLYPALDALEKSYEIIFVNDGSRDRSAAMLTQQHKLRADVTRVILFNGNFDLRMLVARKSSHWMRTYKIHPKILVSYWLKWIRVMITLALSVVSAMIVGGAMWLVA